MCINIDIHLVYFYLSILGTNHCRCSGNSSYSSLFWTTKDKEVKVITMARSMQYTNPKVKASGAKVDSEACQGPRQNYITKDVKRKERSEKKRAEALQEWELANPEHSVLPVARVS